MVPAIEVSCGWCSRHVVLAGGSMTDEKVFLSEAGVLVSKTRFSYGGQTYAMANVTSVREARAGMLAALLLSVVGVLMIISGDGAVRILGVLLLVAGVLLLVFRNTYVVLHTAGGEQRALSSRNKKFVEKVIAAVNEAIIHRG